MCYIRCASVKENSGNYKRKIDTLDYHAKFHKIFRLEVGDKVSVILRSVIVAHGIVNYLISEKHKLWKGIRVDGGKD